MMLVKKGKKSIRRVIEWLRLHREVWQDTNRYFKAASWAGPVKRNYWTHLESDLIRHYHVVEKGLVMPKFKPRSGEMVVKRLTQLLDEWRKSEGDLLNKQYLAGLDVLTAYEEVHVGLEIDISDIMSVSVDKSAPKVSNGLGGVKPLKSISSESDLEELIRSRSSVRIYKEGSAPSDEEIQSAVETAITTPSVCNRQTWKVHVYRGEGAQELLQYQNGNRGFGHLIPVVLIVTVDMRYFSEVAERYQPWIEGGLFSMNLMLALHAKGIGNVPLNWSRTNRDDVKLRSFSKIADYERVIMMVGCGYAEEEVKVPKSCRHDISHFINWNNLKSEHRIKIK